MRLASSATAAMQQGLDDIRATHDVPAEFPDEVLQAARAASERSPGDDQDDRTERIDRTDRRFVTLDPASSLDLDQAFDLERDGDVIVLHYAIADVGSFVRPGDPLDVESWRRGVTIYLPDERAPLYPSVLSEGAASLLPDQVRPAVVFTVRIDGDGEVELAGCERSVIRSRAKLAYDRVTDGDLPEPFAELAERIAAAEDRRGAPRVELPEQELERTGDGWELRFRPRLPSEERNAAMSLACNLAIAERLHAAGTGLFRVMPEVEERQVQGLRQAARALGLEWPDGTTLARFQRSLPREDPRAGAFLVAVRRAGGGASYEPYREGHQPWQSALQATYVHATAPLRRLADRYVIEAALAVVAGRQPPADVSAAFERLPEAMQAGESLASRVERAAVDLAEAVLLDGREGETFEAVVVDEGGRGGGVQVQVADPAILAKVPAHGVDPGDPITVRLVRANPAERRIEFERVS